jgi:hypothetical protein
MVFYYFSAQNGLTNRDCELTEGFLAVIFPFESPRTRTFSSRRTFSGLTVTISLSSPPESPRALRAEANC